MKSQKQFHGDKVTDWEKKYITLFMNSAANIIVFEGLDGAGTTTQSARLTRNVQDAGRSVFQTCEPTDSPMGKLIRKVLRGDVPATPRSLAYLFAADRDDHLFSERGMIARAEAGELVISDRYFYSSLAYQSIDTPYEEVSEINSRFPHPQIIIYLDTPPEVCLDRLSGRESRDTFETLSFQEKVYAAYERAFSALPDEVTLLRFDGTLPIDGLEQRIFQEVSQIMNIASP